MVNVKVIDADFPDDYVFEVEKELTQKEIEEIISSAVRFVHCERGNNRSDPDVLFEELAKKLSESGLVLDK